MKFEQSISINSNPAAIYSAYQNVSDWPKWDPETEAASLDGEFVVGSVGKIKPKGAPVSKIALTEVTPNKSFTVECNLPLCKMLFIHELNEIDNGTEVINQVIFTGLLAPIFGRLIGKGINKSIPDSLKGLKEYIELYLNALYASACL